MNMPSLSLLTVCLSLVVTTCRSEVISASVIDIERGVGAPNIKVTLSRMQNNLQWRQISNRVTDVNGRILNILDGIPFETGVYKLAYNMTGYCGNSCYFPSIESIMRLMRANQKYELPLLVSHYSYEADAQNLPL